jgi:lysophospholipase L1-like esterase
LSLDLPKRRELWVEETSALIRFLRAKGAEVILLNQPMRAVPAVDYERIVAMHPGITFLDLDTKFSELARIGPPGSYKEDDSAWLEEFPEEFRRFYKAKVPGYFYRGDMIHLNRHGQKIIADELAGQIGELLQIRTGSPTD